MGYRNQQIIKDVYGLGAQGAALDKINASIAKGMSDINAAAALQTKIANKEIDDQSKLYAKSSLRQNEILQGLKVDGYNGASLTDQAIKEIEAIMYGSDGVMGSIEAEQMMANSKATVSEKKEYQKIINSFTTSTDRFVTDAALIGTDNEEFLTHANTPSPNSYLVGDGPLEQQTTFLSASVFSGRGLPKGIELKDQIKKGDDLSLVFAVDPNFSSLKDIVAFQNLKVNSDGKKIIKWNRNLTTWDGQSVKKINIESPDYSEIGKNLGVIKNGIVNKQFQALLTPTIAESKDGNQQVKTTDSWVNVDSFLNQFTRTNNDLANDIWQDLQSDTQSGNAYLRQVLKKSGKDYLKLFADGKMNEKEILQEIKEFADESVKEKFNLENGAEITDELGNNLQMIQKPITQSEIDQLILRKIPGADNLKEGDNQYFYRNETTEKKAGPDNQLTVWRSTQKYNLNPDNKFSGDVILGNKTSYGSRPKVSIQKINGLWTAMEFSSTSVSDDGVSISGKIMASPAKGGGVPKPSANQANFYTWLGY